MTAPDPTSPDVHPAIVGEAARLLADPEARARLSDHRAITARGTASERLAYFALSRSLSPHTEAVRNRLLQGLPTQPGPLDQLTIERESGVLVTDQSAWPVVAQAVDEARTCFARAGRAGGDNPGKLFMTTAKLHRPLDSQVMALARDPSVLRLVGRYLGGLPVLFRINLLDSANEALQPDSSQFFHVDPEDFRQVKIFLLVEDVDEDSGPLHLLRVGASDTVQVTRGHRHGRVADHEVMAVCSANDLIACMGRAGTLAIGDTSRCFHFGSRPGRRRRHVVMFQYLSAFASAYPLTATACGGKYAAPVQERAAMLQREVGELDAYLFGICR